MDTFFEAKVKHLRARLDQTFEKKALKVKLTIKTGIFRPCFLKNSTNKRLFLFGGLQKNDKRGKKCMRMQK
ncbi:hypothetical protein MNBD_ALPHA11-2498 [hydrothermal vent metagenome]|uniref:Uncharacterized protein n=1 Tax=hydrothermal vent metagenome TaxID=652676 RepID=A0A3B0U0D8_9ZZZZ